MSDVVRVLHVARGGGGGGGGGECRRCVRMGEGACKHLARLLGVLMKRGDKRGCSSVQSSRERMPCW
jgi:hypothetical protein